MSLTLSFAHALGLNVMTAPKNTRKNSTPFTDENVAQATSEEEDKASMSASVFNLAKNILGAGMLSLPSGVAAFSDSRYSTVHARSKRR